MIIVLYNSDLSRFVFESEPWEIINTDLFFEAGMVLEEIQPASQSDPLLGYVSDGITSYITTGSLMQVEQVCQKIEQFTEVARQILTVNEQLLFQEVPEFK